MRKLLRYWNAFLHPTASDRWLSILRWGLGLQLVCYCLSLRSDWALLLSSDENAFISRTLSESILSIETPLIPRLGWLVTLGGWTGLPETLILQATWFLLLGAGLFLLLGISCRESAALGWFFFLCVCRSGSLTSYGMDNSIIIGLFYLMIAPLPDRMSLDFKVRGLPGKNPRKQGFHRRLLQCHLCVIYFFSGLTKALGPAWWNGTSLWRALTRVPFNVLPVSVVAWFGPILPALGIGVLLLETGFAIFIWPHRTRALWLAGILLMHVMIGLCMGLYLFSLIMIVLNLSAFGSTLISRACGTLSS